jgi:hypothetical protein
MAVETKEIILGGATWRINTMPATIGSEVLCKLLSMIGGSLQGDMAGSGQAAFLATICSKLGDPGTVDLIQKLLGGITKNMRQVNFDLEFAGNYGVLCGLIKWSLEVNFSSFFVGNPVLAEMGMGAADTAPASAT